jgi:NTE family protein
LAQYDPAAGYRFATRQATEDADDVFVVVAFSGGGLRASAMSYGVLEELRDTTVQLPGRPGPSRLLDEVDMITSVSGGSFTAAYYGLFGERTFADFEQKVLRRNFTREAILGVLSPLSAPRLVSPTFDRSDLMAEAYGETVLEGRCYRDMRATRPFIILNAMNLQMGSLFYFTQDHFDFLGSDLDSYTVGNALAASAAVPGAFTPITLRNYPPSAGFVLPAWSRPRPVGASPSPRTVTHTVSSLRRYHVEKRTRPYLHLTDAGFVDNTGLQYFILDLDRGEIRRRLDQGRIHTVLVIMVNADNDRHPNIDCDPSSPGEVTVVIESVFHAIGQATRQTIALVETLINRTCSGATRTRPPPGSMHFVEVNLTNLRDQATRARLLDVPTSLELDDEVVQPLVKSARVLLREHPVFLRFKSELAARARAGAGPAPLEAPAPPPVLVTDPLAPPMPGPSPAASPLPAPPSAPAMDTSGEQPLPAPRIRRVDSR